MSLARLAVPTLLRLSLTAALALAACGDDDPSADVDAAQQPAIDARTDDVDGAPPDADLSCPGETEERCLGLCVDTTTSTLHCGGCTMACDSPGQICGGALPCACPEAFVPASVEPDLATVTEDLFPGMTVALAPIFGDDRSDVVGVGYIPGTTPLDTDIDLSADMAPAVLAAAYDVNLLVDPPTFHTAYFATAGTIHYTTACDVGATGTASGVTLSEINSSDGTIYDGGCTFTLDAFEFSIGDPCPPI